MGCITLCNIVRSRYLYIITSGSGVLCSRPDTIGMESQEPQESPEPQKNNTTLIIIIVVVLAGAAYWFLGGPASPRESERTAPEVEEEAASFGEEVFNAAQEQVATELTKNIPEANPLEGVESNPFDNYQNPFAR